MSATLALVALVVDAAIFVLLVVWFVMDRCNLYFRRGRP